MSDKIQLNFNSCKNVNSNHLKLRIFCCELSALPRFGLGLGLANTSAFGGDTIGPFDVDWSGGSSLTASTAWARFPTGSRFSESSSSSSASKKLLSGGGVLSLLELSMKLVRIRFAGDWESVGSPRRRRDVAGGRSWLSLSWKRRKLNQRKIKTTK